MAMADGNGGLTNFELTDTAPELETRLFFSFFFLVNYFFFFFFLFFE